MKTWHVILGGKLFPELMFQPLIIYGVLFQSDGLSPISNCLESDFTKKNRVDTVQSVSFMAEHMNVVENKKQNILENSIHSPNIT